MIMFREIIKVKLWDVDMLLVASLMIPFWNWTVPFSFVLKRNNCVVKNIFIFIYLVKEWFYYANIVGIIDDSLLEASRAIFIYLCNG